MQNNSNYFEVTINNKYESATTKRKEMKKKLLQVFSVMAICGLMIFSTSVSSNSEVASEDIKWESDIFPSSNEIASVVTASSIEVPSTCTASSVEVVETPSTTIEFDKKEKIVITPSPKRIKSVTKIKSSENQNIPTTKMKKDNKSTITFDKENGVQKNITNMLLHNLVTTTPVSTSLPEVLDMHNRIILTSVSGSAITTSDTVSGSSINIETEEESLVQQNLPYTDSNKEYSEEEEEVKDEIEKEKKEKRIKKILKEQRKRHWKKRGGNAGKPGVFDKVSNKSSIEKKAKAIFDFFTSAGLTDAAACGILGNIEQESTFNVYCATGKYRGMYQLSIYDRFKNATNWCNENGYLVYSIEGQCRFVLQELLDTRSRKAQFEHYTGYTKTSFTKLTNPEQAAYVFCAGYEGCISGGSGRNATWQELSKRKRYARKWYNKFHK